MALDINNIMMKGHNFEKQFLQDALDDAFGKPGAYIADTISLPEKIKDLETHEIEDALIMHNWNVAAASRELGIGRTRLIARMKVLGIKDDSKGR